MKKLICCWLSVIAGFVLSMQASAAEADQDPWASFRFLMGKWTSEGAARTGQGTGTFVFQPELEGKVLVRRNRHERVRGPAQPNAVHEDLMVVYPPGQGQPAKALYWDNEGRVIPYAIRPAADGKSLTFLSETGPTQPRVRLTYSLLDRDLMGVSFAIAEPAKPEEFRVLRESKARRTPRSNVGLSIPRGYVCYRASGPMNMDGKLDEAAWNDAPWTETFLDIEGDLKPVPRLETRAKMLWDDEYFYVAAYLEEPYVWGTLTKHDAVIFQDNDFEIFIDPDGDNHEYYELEINALNTEWDLFLKQPYRDGGPAVNEWEVPGLKTGVHVSGTLNDASDKDNFWTVEFAIPWKVLAEYAHRPAPPRDGDQWRINFSRVEWEHEIKDGKHAKIPNRREDNWVWSPQGFVDMHRPEYWGFVQFSTSPTGSVAFRPDPDQSIRERLIEAYHAQKSYHGKNKRWADRADALDVDPTTRGHGGQTLKILPSPEGFEARIESRPTGEPRRVWSIRQNSRIVREP